MAILIAQPTADIALTAATAKTVVQIVMATNIKGKLLRIGCSFDGTSTTEEPVTILIERQTTAGTMTSLTLVKHDDDDGATIQASAQHTATAEPTGGDDLDRWLVHPQSGIDIFYPLGMEPRIGAGDRIGMVVTAPSTVNCAPKMWFEAA